MYYNIYIYIHTLCIYMLYSCPYLGAYSMMPLWCFFEVGKDRQLKLQPEPTSEVPSIMRWPGWQAKLGISADILQNLLMMALCWCFSHESIIKIDDWNTPLMLEVLQQIPRCWEQPRACWFYKTSGRDFEKSLGECRSNWDVLVINQNLFFLGNILAKWMVFVDGFCKKLEIWQVPELPIYETVRKIPTGRMARGPGAQGPKWLVLGGTHNSPRWCWKHGKICFEKWISPWKK